MYLLGQAPVDGWSSVIQQFGVPVAVLIFIGAGVTWVTRRLFAKGGWLDALTDRCLGEHGIVTSYVESNADMVATLKTHLKDDAARMSKIVEVQQQIGILVAKLADKQEEMGVAIGDLTTSETDRHLEMLAKMQLHTEAIDAKVDSMVEMYKTAAEHDRDQKHLIEAALVACDVLDSVLPESKDSIAAVRKKLTG